MSPERSVSAEERAAGNPLGYQPIGRLLLNFSIPSVISMLVNSIYNIVDQIFIGQGVGELGNAATTVSFPMVTIMLAFATLIGSGGSAYAALKLGEGKNEEADRTLNNVFVMALGAGVLLLASGLLFLEPMLRVFGAGEAVMPYAKDYASILLLGAPFNMMGIALSNMARTDGSPRLSMYGILIGAILNTVLDPIYIFVFHWGVKGAAIATITSQIISAVILLAYFATRSRHMRFRLSAMRPEGSIWGRVVSLGISAGITQAVSVIMQIVMNNSLLYYGSRSEAGAVTAQAAMGIVMKVAMILLAFCIGIGVGAQPILGFNRGARKFHRVKGAYLRAVAAATVAVTLGWLLCQTIPHVILSLFGSASPAFTDFAVRSMRIYLFGIFCAGFQVVSTNYFQATGQPLKASLLSMLRQLLLLIPLLLILPLFWGLDGILYAGPIADLSSGVIVALFILPEMRKLDRQVQEEDARAAASGR